MQQWFGWLASIWPPNLSQFLPDLFNAGATGAVVALIVWWLQIRRETKAAKAAARDDWNRLKVWLRQYFGQELELLPETVTYGNPSLDLRVAIERYPVEEWARLLPEHGDIVALAELEREWPRMREAQLRVLNLIPGAVIEGASEGHGQQGQVVTIITGAVRARVNADDNGQEQARRTVQQWGMDASIVDEWTEAALEHDSLAEAVAELRRRFLVTSTAFAAVKDAVGA